MADLPNEHEQLSFINKFFKRFIFCYLFLYVFPYGFEYIYSLNTENLSFWTSPVIWFGEKFLSLDYNTQYLSKGFDSKYDFTRFILCIVISIITAFIWMAIDSKYQLKYNGKLYALLRIIVRYHLGLTLIMYGILKVFPLQFSLMSIDKLETKIGEISPMGFLWYFMSYSEFYTITTGIIEVIAGILLLFRATTLLGAFISFIAMANVVLIDIGYDATVKFFAIHLFLMTIVLLMDDIKRFVNFLVLNKTVPPAHYPDLLTSKRSKQVGYLIKSAILIYFFITTISMLGERMKTEHNYQNQHLSKLYKVEKFVINGDTIPPVSTDTIRWKNISINGTVSQPNMLIIKGMNDLRTAFSFKADTVRKTLVFHPYSDSTDVYFLRYRQLSANNFIFYGKHNNDSLWIQTIPVSVKDYRLMKYGIRWVRDL